MNKEIQDKINKFFEQYGKNKIKQINGFCFKGKKKCPYTARGSCRGWCMGQRLLNKNLGSP